MPTSDVENTNTARMGCNGANNCQCKWLLYNFTGVLPALKKVVVLRKIIILYYIYEKYYRNRFGHNGQWYCTRFCPKQL